jgi:hypothetical protein
MSSKYRLALTIGLLGILTVGSLSAMGLLQSIERIGASGIIVRPVVNPIIPPSSGSPPTPPPPEPEIEIDVYSDSECTTAMSGIEWGEIEAGEEKSVQIYVKNSGDTSVVISLITENWSLSTAQNNMDLTWSYDGTPIQSGEAIEVTLMLSVDLDCPEIINFGFDVIIIAS